MRREITVIYNDDLYKFEINEQYQITDITWCPGCDRTLAESLDSEKVPVRVVTKFEAKLQQLKELL